MQKLLGLIVLACGLFIGNGLVAHCQMPCGIFHDDIVYQRIDEYIETMAKAVKVLKENTFETTQDKNAFVRWVGLKEHVSDEMANLMLTYFLQQKIKPGEEETPKRLISAHKLLFLMVKIKQNVDMEIVNQFSAEWKNFKELFSPSTKKEPTKEENEKRQAYIQAMY